MPVCPAVHFNTPGNPSKSLELLLLLEVNVGASSSMTVNFHIWFFQWEDTLLP